ncbi:uracil-DNA glycosylase family protein [Skermania sp. ID1734]|uniref:uracil-DNA glycosylase family protein n=1 Tax=Skermania sp. ID1734 TaxID=2597516 RepID=UPI00117F82EC|nr:uracil-DNA glycosylase family protein [Skermania sp. ID1734]TSD98128.1 uracil-DNA glycosylase family protein [Skermania sp. ID1734]
MPTLTQLLVDIRACTLCADLPCGPRPVLQAGRSARLRIIGQAPGRKVHQTGIPWDDPSGVRLREWLGLTPAEFYDPDKVAIMPMGFCYPGKAVSGDNPPRTECASQWHPPLNAQMPDITLTLLVGQYAHAYYLGRRRKSSLTETVRAWREYLPDGFVPLPHPSPRNQPWLSKNPWFEKELVPAIQAEVRAMGL